MSNDATKRYVNEVCRKEKDKYEAVRKKAACL